MTRRRADATGALFDGSKQGTRTQRVYTPREVVSVLDELWPEGVFCDPTAGPDQLVDAMIKIMPPANGCRYVDEIPLIGEDGEAVWAPDAKGKLKLVYIPAPPGCPVWPERTYGNPEFGDLKPWIRQFAESWECVFLFPVRTNRTWWRRAILGPDVCRAWLDPIKFVGHDQAFPAPLVLAYRGDRRDTYKAAVERAGIGECIP